MAVGFDSTMLSLLLNPDTQIPADPSTGLPVDLAKERVEFLVASIQKQRQKIVVPTPVVAEILTLLGPTSAKYLQIINKSVVFEVRPFDEIAAIELSFLNRDVFATQDTKNKLEPYQKIKIDRQILAVCRVAKCNVLYTDDKGLINRAAMCDIQTRRLCEVSDPSFCAPIPYAS